MITDHTATARSYSRTASSATRRAEREARLASQMYVAAGQKAQHARWLTGRPELERDDMTAARYETDARSFARMGDTYLQGSFRATDSATFYRDLAASYREMAARYGK